MQGSGINDPTNANHRRRLLQKQERQIFGYENHNDLGGARERRTLMNNEEHSKENGELSKHSKDHEEHSNKGQEHSRNDEEHSSKGEEHSNKLKNIHSTRKSTNQMHTSMKSPENAMVVDLNADEER